MLELAFDWVDSVHEQVSFFVTRWSSHSFRSTIYNNCVWKPAGIFLHEGPILGVSRPIQSRKMDLQVAFINFFIFPFLFLSHVPISSRIKQATRLLSCSTDKFNIVTHILRHYWRLFSWLFSESFSLRTMPKMLFKFSTMRVKKRTFFQRLEQRTYPEVGDFCSFTIADIANIRIIT